MSSFLELLKERVLFFDGAMGTALHSLNIPLSDYQGKENCSEILVLTRPEAIRQVHEQMLSAGADVVETDTFGANRIVLSEFDLASETSRINRCAAELARQSCKLFTSPDKPRFVAGSIGPGTKLPSLGQVDFNTLEYSYHEQIRGLMEGGVDLLLIETCQDILQTKSAIAAAERAFHECGYRLPVMAQVTMESNGTMLLGTDIGAALPILSCFSVDVIGINCATGPQEMSEHVSYLGRHSNRFISVMPNAGLPLIVDGRSHYPLSPEEFARWLVRFVEEDGVNIVGGCCGTTWKHIEAAVKAIGIHAPKYRAPAFESSLASLYSRTAIRQDASCLLIGERTNANGSKKFRELLAEEDWDAITALARDQECHGSHLLDVCTAYVGRDEKRDMVEIIRRFSTQLTAPLVIDSTEAPVIEAALGLCGGKCLVNSVHLEDGENRLASVLPLCKKYGSAVVALTIDELGMAKTADRKMEVAGRIYRLATEKFGMAPQDIFFDPLTFTICTGNEDDRPMAEETLRAVELLTREFPESHTLLGVSNVSFGLNPAPRKILNSVFLHHARERGLTSAIVHTAAILPYFRIAEEARQICDDLIFNRRRDDYDPLPRLMQLFSTETVQAPDSSSQLSLEDRLKRHILHGERKGLDRTLQEALQTHAPLIIINEILLSAMKTVGELFGAGQMQLPFVLQSAETMKAAVSLLEPHMDRSSGPSRGRLVLATVRGDVHDIGKNLVDIILSNNGFTVFNLGIKQPIHAILEAAQREKADAVGMSGLLVKSVMVMKENLEEMNRQGINIPVILGGAALTRNYVQTDCKKLYSGSVAYAKDAFEGLRLMEQICEKGKDIKDSLEISIPPEKSSTAGDRPPIAVATPPKTSPRPLPEEDSEATAFPLSPADVPVPPFWGTRILESIPLRAVLPFINETMLFSFQWGYRKAGLSKEKYELQLQELVYPRYRTLIETCLREDLLRPCAVYGFYRCQSEGNDILIYGQEGEVPSRFGFTRQSRPPGRCLADYFHRVDSGIMDLIALQAVTVGPAASLAEKRRFAENRYTDYLHLHGLSVEAAEATAEYVHRQIRIDLGISSEDDREIRNLLKLGYRGCRYSFGYPACPRLEDQPTLLEILGAERIGLTLGDNYQMWPEQSTSALVIHHPQANYFSVG